MPITVMDALQPPAHFLRRCGQHPLPERCTVAREERRLERERLKLEERASVEAKVAERQAAAEVEARAEVTAREEVESARIARVVEDTWYPSSEVRGKREGILEGEGMSEVCRALGISRNAGYKIFNRYKDDGLEALTDRSRRPVR